MDFPSKIVFNNINHGYRAAILKKSSLSVLLSYMVVATYCYHKKERRPMHSAIVFHLLEKESQLNEVCLGHKVRCTVFIRRRARAQLLMIYKISTYLCPKDERESLKKLITSHQHISYAWRFTTEQSKRKYFDSAVKIFKAKCIVVRHSN